MARTIPGARRPAPYGGPPHRLRGGLYAVVSPGVIWRIMRAGTPATTVIGGTCAVTTAPAATTAPRPTVTPGRMVAFAPTQASSSMVTTAENWAAVQRRAGSSGWPAARQERAARGASR